MYPTCVKIYDERKKNKSHSLQPSIVQVQNTTRTGFYANRSIQFMHGGRTYVSTLQYRRGNYTPAIITHIAVSLADGDWECVEFPRAQVLPIAKGKFNATNINLQPVGKRAYLPTVWDQTTSAANGYPVVTNWIFFVTLPALLTELVVTGKR